MNILIIFQPITSLEINFILTSTDAMADLYVIHLSLDITPIFPLLPCYNDTFPVYIPHFLCHLISVYIQLHFLSLFYHFLLCRRSILSLPLSLSFPFSTSPLLSRRQPTPSNIDGLISSMNMGLPFLYFS